MSKEEILSQEFKSESIWQDRSAVIAMVVLLALIVLTWVLWVVLYRQVETPIGMPLYFNFLQVYPGIYRYVLPIFGVAISVFHVLIAWFAYRKEKMVSYFLIGGACFVELLILVTVVYYMIYV